MPALPLSSRRALFPAVLWALGCVVLMALAQIASDTSGGWRFDRAAYQAGAWWQLFSSQWVHFGVNHAALNAVCLVAMVLAFQGLVCIRVQGMALVGGAIGVAACIALDPACQYYAGASGALHGLWAGCAVALMAFAPPARGRFNSVRVLGVAMLVAVGIKLYLLTGVGHAGVSAVPVFSALVLGRVPVYTPAHEAGAAGGVLAVLVWGWLGRRVST